MVVASYHHFGSPQLRYKIFRTWTPEGSGQGGAGVRARTEEWITALEAKFLPAYQAPRYWFGTADKQGVKAVVQRLLWLRHWKAAVAREEGAGALGGAALSL